MARTIGTHNGKFHCDEALACFMLKRLNQFSDYKVVRTRDRSLLEECEILVDVGGKYDHSRKRYDHHQKDFAETMDSLNCLETTTKLSSAGLVYAHYGKQLIMEILNVTQDSKMIAIFFRKLYQTFIEAIDAVDNGIKQYDGLPRYYMPGGIWDRVSYLNPKWNEADVDTDKRFEEAMQLIGGEFESSVRYLAEVWWPARTIVEKAIDERRKVDESERIVLMSEGVPWKEHFFHMEEEKKLTDLGMAYIIFKDTISGRYRVQAIPDNSATMFDSRIPFPKEWCGLSGDKLDKASGIRGCVFVHMGGFIGENVSYEGAVAMAKKSLELKQKNDKTKERKRR